MKLTPSAQSSENFIVNLEKKKVKFVLPKLQSKYGKIIKNIWSHEKLPIKPQKSEDLFTMRTYCQSLTEEELEYWFPKPNNNEIILQNIMEEEEKNEIIWLEKKIVNFQKEKDLLDEIEKNI